MKRVLVPLATGFEELEAVTVIDLLRRADINVIVASLEAGPVTGRRGTRILADEVLHMDAISDYDMIVLPGGLPGADNLNADPRIHDILQKLSDSKKYIAAICAAPKILAKAGLLKNINATSFPGAMDGLKGAANLNGNAVCIDGNIITSRGPGTAIDFSLALIQLLNGIDSRNKVELALQR